MNTIFPVSCSARYATHRVGPEDTRPEKRFTPLEGRRGPLSTLIGLAMLGLMVPAQANAVTVTPTSNGNTLAQKLPKGNAIQITSATFTGSSKAGGTYVQGPLAMEDGIALSTGDVSQIPYVDGKKTLSTDLGTAGSSLCSQISPGTPNFDAALLTVNFDLAAGFDGIQFSFVMSSDEYPDYVGSAYSDAFGIFLDGVNIALDQKGNALNISGPFFSSGSVIKGPATGTEFNGSTPRLLASGALTGGTKGHTLQIVTCDVGDSGFDTGVFVAGLEGCKGSCNQTIWCGDGKINGAEECDDANNVNGDGCSVDCKLEAPPKSPNGNKCASATACASGFCVDGVCCAVSSCVSDSCRVGVCQPDSGLCAQVAKSNGTACDDDNACTHTDSCQEGVCTGADPVICLAHDECLDTGACDPATGMCTETAKVDGTMCSAGACTQGACMSASDGTAASTGKDGAGCGCYVAGSREKEPAPIALSALLFAMVALAGWHCRLRPKRH